MKKRFLSILLTMAMLLSLLPMAAFAEDTGESCDGTSCTHVAAIGEFHYATLQDAINNVSENGTITLLRNVESGDGVKVTSGKNFTLDLGTYTYSVNGELVGSSGTQTNGFQLLKDSTITIKNGKIDTRKAKILIQNYANLTLDGVELVGDGMTEYVMSNNNGETKLTGKTTITATEGNFAFDVCWAKAYTDGARVTVESGVVINGDVELGLWNQSTYDASKSVLTVTGGTFNGEVKPDPGKNANDVKANVKINGGTFTSDVSAYLEDGYFQSADGIVSQLTLANAVAKIGETPYATLLDAYNAVPRNNTTNKTTITLLKDATGGGIGTDQDKGMNYEIDFGGHTYTVTAPAVGSSGTETQALRVLQGSTAVFKDGTLKASADPNLLQIVHTYGDVTLQDFTIDAREDSYAQIAVEADCGTFNITGNSSILAYPGKIGLYAAFWHFGTYDGTTVNVDTTGKITGKLVYEFDERKPGGVAADTNKGILNIENGLFDISEIEVLFSNVANEDLKDAKINISGGYFTVDPSKYLVDNKAALVSDKAGYSFMVGEKKVEVIPAPPAVENPVASDEGKSADEKTLAGNLETALKATDSDKAPSVSEEVITAAANTAAQNNNVTTETSITVNGETKTVEEAVKALNSEQKEPVVVIVVRPYLDIAITDVKIEDETKTLTLDITPKAKTVATTQAVIDATDTDIEIGGDAPNAVPIKDEVLTITQPVEVTIPLPAGFVTAGNEGKYPNIYINHVKGGRTYTYTATVAEESGTLFATFTNPHGFSEFTLTTVNDAVAEVDGVGYATFQDAVDAVANNGTINVRKEGTYTVSGNKTFKITKASGIAEVTLTAASGYNLNNTGDIYTVSRRSSGGSSATYAINVEKSTHGTVTASGKNAAQGRTVTLTVKADEGYVLDELTVTDAKGKDVELTKKSATSYTFEMPASAVTVEASFKEGEHECPLAGFNDLNEGAWYHEAVDYVLNEGIMSGVSGSGFAPNGTLTRAMVVQTLWAAQGKPVVNYAMSFSDVSQNDWYAESVRWAVSEGVVSGYSESQFGPNDPVTREQLMTILYAYAKNEGKGFAGAWMMQLGYADAEQISSWAYEAACWCSTNGVVSGKTGNVLDPQGTATRAEAAQMLVNFMEIMEG